MILSRPCLFSAALFLFTVPRPARGADQGATLIIKQALAAQGGEQKLRSLQSVQWEAVGYRNELEQSERPEGPYTKEFDTITETDDIAGKRYRRVIDGSVYPLFKFSSGVVVNEMVAMRLSGDTKAPGTPTQWKSVEERRALSPERLLLTALAASDAQREPDTIMQSVPQNVIGFTLDGAPVRIYLNAYTHLPTATDYSGPLARSNFYSFLGDATMRTYYSLWWLAKGGIHFPLQWEVETNGLPDQMIVIRKLDLDAPLDQASLAIPPDIRAKYNPDAPASDPNTIPLGDPSHPVKEIEPGIVFIAGSWNVTLVRQEDGVVVLEAPISSGYSEKVLTEAHRWFPNLPIKAVITTSDSWPHLAGIREYVANGTPIYALDLNLPILKRVIAAPYKSRPDALEKHPVEPRFRPVSGKTIIGSGPNQMELYPIRGETSERQMLVYFPQHKLLYGSDPFQPAGDGTFYYPQTVTELTDAVRREHLDVEKFFMMHEEPTPYSELGKAVEDAEKQNTPTGKL